MKPLIQRLHFHCQGIAFGEPQPKGLDVDGFAKRAGEVCMCSPGYLNHTTL